MRKLIVSSLLAVAVSLAPGCKEPDPNKFETHIDRIKDADKRASGFDGLDKLTKTVITAEDNDDLLEEFAQKVVPAFDEIWADAPEQQEKMLVLLRDVGHPAGATIWNKALELDGSSDARKRTIIALEGIRKAKPEASVDALLEQLKALMKNPKLDAAEGDEGRVRALMADALGAIGDKKAVPVLIEVLQQPPENQPTTVHRAAARALGQLGDPAAIDALLEVPFRVPDAPTTTNIAEQSKIALAAIGAPAVPKVIAVLKGENETVKKLAAEALAKSGGEQEVSLFLIQQSAAGILAAMGAVAKPAVDDLIAYMPKDDCTADKKKDEEPDVDKITLRAFIANALGFIGDPKGADALCTCVTTSDRPDDLLPMIEALGRVRGEKAVSCLLDVVKESEYTTEAVVDDAKYTPRWEAGRSVVLAALPADVAKIRETFAAATDATVKQELAAWEPGLALLEECKDERACYEKVLKDINANWFAREKAAVEVARLAEAGDAKAAEAISEAFKVRNPAARVTMAWLPGQIVTDKKCPKCVSSFAAVLDAEKTSMDATYQLSVLTARYATAKLRERKQEGDAGAGG